MDGTLRVRAFAVSNVRNEINYFDSRRDAKENRRHHRLWGPIESLDGSADSTRNEVRLQSRVSSLVANPKRNVEIDLIMFILRR